MGEALRDSCPFQRSQESLVEGEGKEDAMMSRAEQTLGKEGMLEVGAGGHRERGGVAFLVWAVELLGEGVPRDTSPGPKVQQADLREEPSSTHHPGKESERPGMGPMGRGRKGLVMVKARNDPLLIWLGARRKARSGEKHAVNTEMISSEPALAATGVSLCILVRLK